MQTCDVKGIVGIVCILCMSCYCGACQCQSSLNGTNKRRGNKSPYHTWYILLSPEIKDVNYLPIKMKTDTGRKVHSTVIPHLINKTTHPGAGGEHNQHIWEQH